MTESQSPIFYAKKDYFSGAHAVTMVNCYEVNDGVAPHGHEFFEIALASAGCGRHISANGLQILGPGNLIIIRPGAWHGYIHCDRLVVHNCGFDQQLLRNELGWLREDVLMNFLLWTGPYLKNRRGVMIVRVREESLRECLEHWESLSQVQNLPRRAETLGRFLILIDSLARSVQEIDILRQQPQPLHPAVLEAFHLLETQIERDWSLGELAETIHLNPSYLVRLFRAGMGLSPIAYLNRCRLERATELLLHTSLPIAEVAAQVGWYDPNLFARRFRIAYGMSPSEYRKHFGRSQES